MAKEFKKHMMYDPETGKCFGLVDGFEVEFGYFNINEIKKIKGKFGLPVERDQWFDATSAEELVKELKK